MNNSKEIVTVLGVVIVSLGVMLIINGVMLMINSAQQIAEPVLNCQTKIDSLETELFIEKSKVGRYEMALETFKEEDSVGADHFEHILSTKTE